MSASGNPQEESKSDEAFLWNAEDVNRDRPWSLIDYRDEEYWSQAEHIKEAIQKSERLQKISGQPRNRIVSLPNSSSVLRHFYCATCNEIPFPWTLTPERILGIGDAFSPKAVYLCNYGHAVCRKCYLSYFTCVFSDSDCDYVLKNGNNDLKIKEQDHLAQVDRSNGKWGRIQLCMDRLSPYFCAFLTEMISTAEFACRYYYNWCNFRGSGKQLERHERWCPFAYSKLEQELEDENQPAQSPQELSLTGMDNDECDGEDDDAGILKLDLDTIKQKAHEMIWDVILEHKDEIQMDKIPEYVLRGSDPSSPYVYKKKSRSRRSGNGSCKSSPLQTF